MCILMVIVLYNYLIPRSPLIASFLQEHESIDVLKAAEYPKQHRINRTKKATMAKATKQLQRYHNSKVVFSPCSSSPSSSSSTSSKESEYDDDDAADEDYVDNSKNTKKVRKKTKEGKKIVVCYGYLY